VGARGKRERNPITVSFERENTKPLSKRGKETEIPSSLTAPDVNEDETHRA
jgi:hypothetical protein